MHHFAEQFNGGHGHQNPVCRILNPLGIFFYPENADFAVFACVSLQSFKTFLAIMQASCGHVNADVFGRGYFDFSPLSVPVVAADIVVGIVVTEWERLPINCIQIDLHNLRPFVLASP